MGCTTPSSSNVCSQMQLLRAIREEKAEREITSRFQQAIESLHEQLHSSPCEDNLDFAQREEHLSLAALDDAESGSMPFSELIRTEVQQRKEQAAEQPSEQPIDQSADQLWEPPVKQEELRALKSPSPHSKPPFVGVLAAAQAAFQREHDKVLKAQLAVKKHDMGATKLPLAVSRPLHAVRPSGIHRRCNAVDEPAQHGHISHTPSLDNTAHSSVRPDSHNMLNKFTEVLPRPCSMPADSTIISAKGHRLQESQRVIRVHGRHSVENIKRASQTNGNDLIELAATPAPHESAPIGGVAQVPSPAAAGAVEIVACPERPSLIGNTEACTALKIGSAAWATELSDTRASSRAQAADCDELFPWPDPGEPLQLDDSFTHSNTSPDSSQASCIPTSHKGLLPNSLSLCLFGATQRVDGWTPAGTGKGQHTPMMRSSCCAGHQPYVVVSSTVGLQRPRWDGWDLDAAIDGSHDAALAGWEHTVWSALHGQDPQSHVCMQQKALARLPSHTHSCSVTRQHPAVICAPQTLCTLPSSPDATNEASRTAHSIWSSLRGSIQSLPECEQEREAVSSSDPSSNASPGISNLQLQKIDTSQKETDHEDAQHQTQLRTSQSCTAPPSWLGKAQAGAHQLLAALLRPRAREPEHLHRHSAAPIHHGNISASSVMALEPRTQDIRQYGTCSQTKWPSPWRKMPRRQSLCSPSTSAKASGCTTKLDIDEASYEHVYQDVIRRCQLWRRQLSAAGLAKGTKPVPNLEPAANSQKRYFLIITDAEHPEVANLLFKCLTKLHWQEYHPCISCSGFGTIASNPSEFAAQIKKCPHESHLWNLLWTWSPKHCFPAHRLMMWQKINHFQECRHLTRKDLLNMHIQRHAAIFGKSSLALMFQCMPTTFCLPKERARFEEIFACASNDNTEPFNKFQGDHMNKKAIVQCTQHMCLSGSRAQIYPQQSKGLNVWIVKPNSLSRGRGVHIADCISKVICEQASVVQRYIMNPLLLHHHKFDCRIYVLVTSFHPLEAFIHQAGFARVALKPYSSDASTWDDVTIHLTNASIQSKLGDPLPPTFSSECPAEPCGASKISLERLWILLSRLGIQRCHIWDQVRSVALAALFSVQDAIPSQVNSFELLGFDVIIDEDHKVWLLEVNSSPSLGLGTPLDDKIKSQVIEDTLQLVNPLAFDRTALELMLSRRSSSRAGHGRLSRRQGGGLLAGTLAEEEDLLDTELHAVLGGAYPRSLGTAPQYFGGYETLAPSPLLRQLSRMKR